VAKPDKPTMQPANTVQIDSHAAATLRYIRTSMEAAVSITVPGSAGIAMGIVGLLAMIASSTPALHDRWLTIWLLAAAVAGGMGIALMAQPASLRGLTLSGTPIRKFALCLFPALFGGAVMTVVLWTSGNMHAIPGTWLLFYGCALIAASVPTTRIIGFMGGLFVALGLLALLLPDRFQTFMLGIGFGGLHVLFGYLIGRTAHDKPV
jgi:hypothetical protein